MPAHWCFPGCGNPVWVLYFHQMTVWDENGMYPSKTQTQVRNLDQMVNSQPFWNILFMVPSIHTDIKKFETIYKKKLWDNMLRFSPSPTRLVSDRLKRCILFQTSFQPNQILTIWMPCVGPLCAFIWHEKHFRCYFDALYFSKQRPSSSKNTSVPPSIRPSVTPFSQCSCHSFTKLSGVITIATSDVHVKGQGQNKLSTNFGVSRL